jgi:hypothetical protein
MINLLKKPANFMRRVRNLFSLPANPAKRESTACSGPDSFIANRDATADQRAFTYIVVLLFFFFGLLGIIKHEMWRDELQAWLIARDSLSLPDLLFNMRYEGHPPVWHILLFFITRLTDQTFFMQLLHLITATLGIGVFVMFAPFPKVQKVLFAFGFFPSYMYAVISRGYALGILFIFIFCAMFSKPAKKYSMLFALIFLITQCNFTGAIIALAAGFFLLSEIAFSGRQLSNTAMKIDAGAGALLFFCTITLIFYQVQLPSDTLHPWAPGFFTQVDFQRIARTFPLINDIYLPFSQSIFQSTVPREKISLILSGMELILVSLILLRKPRVLFLYLSGTFGLLAMFYIKYGLVWHQGHLFILLIACLWIADSCRGIDIKPHFPGQLSAGAEKYKGIFIVLVLSLHFAWGAVAHFKDWKYPYSAAKETARFIEDNGMGNMPMIGDTDFAISPVTGYLNNRIYYIRGARVGSYVLWDNKRVERVINSDTVIAETENLLARKQQDVLIILNYELNPLKMPARLRRLKQFTNSLTREEVYYLYLLPLEKN